MIWSCRGLIRPLRNISFKRWLSTSLYEPQRPGKDDAIYVAMSSGVDSSTVAALMAQKHGTANVRGIFMANWQSTAKCSEADWNDVQKVCAKIGIACERVNFEREYWMEVFEPMIELYKAGLTPNPDVGCNRHIKFGSLIQYLKSKHASNNRPWWLATGHYADVQKCTATGEKHLLRPKDLSKDQSYYLSSIDPTALNHILFPLAQYSKPEIRGLASQFQLHTAEKPDSQGLCFVSQNHNSFRKFLAEYVESTPGEVVTEEGKVVGKHEGLWHATIGQRSSISMPQGDPKYRGSWYVSQKDIPNNRLIIVKGVDNPSLYSSALECSNFHWLGQKPTSSNNLTIQYRSLMEPVPIQDLNESPTESLRVSLQEPCRAIAPGQYLVLYDGRRVLGSGIITANCT
ncbi:hypothetical protein TRICI_006177 [Trichomonascus ciferrii]|uniref:tRNA-5-taurinomethyluridine 2-sulfurtransferase n=1 Tax=Trichomonascus ciferrii TaxID=44093 RepID=A0A642URW3_9ASCO|nr:hypothetical protein TRICI_006177 [Trichomonascus ciferrii]